MLKRGEIVARRIACALDSVKLAPQRPITKIEFDEFAVDGIDQFLAQQDRPGVAMSRLAHGVPHEFLAH